MDEIIGLIGYYFVFIITCVIFLCTIYQIIVKNSKDKTIVFVLTVTFSLFLNFTFQFYCVPVIWLSIVIILYIFLNILADLFVQNKILRISQLLINGFFTPILIFFFVFIFTDIDNYSIPIIFILFTLLIITTSISFAFKKEQKFTLNINLTFIIPPIYFLLHIFSKLQNLKSVLFFSAGIIICLLVILFSFQKFTKISNSIEKSNFENYVSENEYNYDVDTLFKNYVVFKDKDIEKLSKQFESNYFTEMIIGMHFIYHTRMCYYDGWRPPFHEPLLNIYLLFSP